MNETELNLLKAFEQLQTPTVNHTYRIYYSPINGLCTKQSIDLFDEPHIEVDKETYNSISILQYQVVDGKLEPRKYYFDSTKCLTKADQGKYRTIKGHSMFLATNNYDGPVDYWKLNYE